MKCETMHGEICMTICVLFLDLAKLLEENDALRAQRGVQQKEIAQLKADIQRLTQRH